MLSKQCKLQLDAEGKTGSQHFRDTIKTAITMQFMIPALLVNAVAPRFFAKETQKFKDTHDIYSHGMSSPGDKDYEV